MSPLPFLTYSLLLLVSGYALHAVIGGRWVEARNVHKFGDPRHLWITLRGQSHALTDDQLNVAQARADRLQDPRRRNLVVSAWLAGLCLLLSVFWFTGCAPQRTKEDQTPAGSSRLTKADAGSLAAIYAAKHGGSWCLVAPTGSMAPVIDSRSVLLLEPYAGQPILAGDIVCFDRGDNPNVCHRVVEVKDGAFYVSGDNNKWPDGWHKLAAIKYRVAGIIFTAR